MPARVHLADAALLTGEFSGSSLRNLSVAHTPLSTHLSDAEGYILTRGPFQGGRLPAA